MQRGRELQLITVDDVVYFRADNKYVAVVTADNGRKGIRMASAHRPDLVVTDIVMPDIEGIGAIRAIKGGARPPKIIAISGAGRGRGMDYLSWAKHLGADEVLAKPFRMSELLKVSKSVIANSPVQSIDLGS